MQSCSGEIHSKWDEQPTRQVVPDIPKIGKKADALRYAGVDGSIKGIDPYRATAWTAAGPAFDAPQLLAGGTVAVDGSPGTGAPVDGGAAGGAGICTRVTTFFSL
jgi:hypothetical protein